MAPAIDIDAITRVLGQSTGCESRDRPGHLARRASAGDGKAGGIGDVVEAVPDFTIEVGTDDARADLIGRDAKGRPPQGEGLGDARQIALFTPAGASMETPMPVPARSECSDSDSATTANFIAW